MEDITGLDITPLKTKGFQHVPAFLPDDVKQDLARRAQEVIDLRASGKMSSDSQDSKGLEYEWYKPLLLHPKLLDLVTSVLGPDVVCSGWRVLAKDKHFRQAVHVHQDWPYNPGDTTKLTVFLPLTRVNFANGGLIFLEESHYYGPVSRGPIDLSRFPPMVEDCPDVDVGDIIICDFLTWHYSLPKQNDDERLMVQLNYQPARDASNNNIVAGKLPHNKVLHNRLDAVSVPSVELNCVQAKAYLAEGDMDRATRYARGLIFDDPEHAGAALLLHDILSGENDPSALTYLEMARAAVNKLQTEIAVRDKKYGITPSAPLAVQAAPAAPVAGSPWQVLDLTFKSFVDGHPDQASLPANLGTPETAWAYGAISAVVQTDKPATIRVRAKALEGKIGLCLISEDCSELASDQHMLTPESGDASVMIAFTPEKSPARLLVRNFDDAGNPGEVSLQSVDILAYA
jgi:hypothetical protein